VGRLEKRFAVITGGASGIGRVIAEAYLSEGAEVLIADLNGDRASQTAAELEKLGKVYALACDVTKVNDVKALSDEALRVFGKVNVLINNAGLSGRGLISEIAEDTIDALLNVNLKGVIICAKVFAPILKNANDAVMINMSSQAGKRGWAELSVYGATKAGVLGMNRALAVELAPEVRVNAICPGYISEVGMAWRGWDSKSKKEGGDAGSIGTKFAIDNIPLERLQTADDIARSAVFLGSNDAKEITGAALNVGGGVVMD
jgi:NAD(P)-dependent dehydrogenase (short-subunit alcohol dehydrogenase family)